MKVIFIYKDKLNREKSGKLRDFESKLDLNINRGKEFLDQFI